MTVTIPAIPIGTLPAGFVAWLETVKAFGDDTESRIAALEAGGGSSTLQGVPFSRHGVKKDSSTDNTAALAACVADAIGEGSLILVDDVPPDANGDHILVNGRVDFKNLYLEGAGEELSVIRGVASGAGVDWNAYGQTVKYGGGGRRFSVYGGPLGSPGVCNRPMTVGLLTMPWFSQFRAWGALSGADGVSLLLAATQNGKFDLAWPGGGDVPLRFDAGASANHFAKYEISAGAKNLVEFRANLASPPGQQAYTVYNQLAGEGIIEAPLSTTQHMVYSAAGALNTINGTVSVNAPAFGGTNPTGMVEAIKVECTESVQGSLVLEDVKLNGGSVTGIIGANADVATGARIHLRGGSVGSVTYGFKGNVVIEAEPWFFSTALTKYDLGGILSVIPRHSQIAPNYIQPPSTAATVWGMQVAGESNLRAYLLGDGLWRAGNGTASADVSWGRIGAGLFGCPVGHLFIGDFNQQHLVDATGHHVWMSASTGKLMTKASAPTSTSDGTVVGTQT
jgi:hypothetical protein